MEVIRISGGGVAFRVYKVFVFIKMASLVQSSFFYGLAGLFAQAGPGAWAQARPGPGPGFVAEG